MDLKQSTSEEDRLKSDIFHTVPDREHRISHQVKPVQSKLSQLGEGASQDVPVPPPGIPADDKVMRSLMVGKGNSVDYATSDINRDESADPVHSVVEHRAGSMSDISDDCGIVFNNTHALQKHVKRGCPEDDNEMTSTKRRKLELLRNWQELPSKEMKGRGDDDDGDDGIDDDGSDDSDDDDDDIGFRRIMNNVFTKLDDEFGNRVDQHMDKGANTKDAISEVNTIMRPAYRKGLVAAYKDFLILVHDLNKNQMHRDIMKHLQLAKNINTTFKRLIRSHISEFDMMLDSVEEKAEDESSEGSDDNEQTSEDDGEKE